jgi:hypothetical protein
LGRTTIWLHGGIIGFLFAGLLRTADGAISDIVVARQLKLSEHPVLGMFIRRLRRAIEQGRIR